MPTRGRADRVQSGPGLSPAPDRVRRARAACLALTLALAAALLAAFWNGIDHAAVPVGLLGVAMALFAVNALWLAAGAAVALVGLPGAAARDPAARDVPQGATARPGRTAILWLLCGEPPGPVAARATAMARDLDAAGLAGDCDIFILSDTQAAGPRLAETHCFAPMVASGLLRYRNRPRNTGRKPGNIADWLRRHGAGYETMLVMDADSAMSVDRLQTMRRLMAAAPGLGLVQSGIRVVPGQSRFSALQRLSARLLGPAFLRGFAAVTGDAGNYWGHNALIRVRAFAEAAGLPSLPGRPPLGGPVLSHDFVEAAWLVRAGWGVRVLPDARGSFEASPETLGEFHRRDRRWCQGNLQHLRLIGAAGLHPLSRLHLICGVQSYLAAPVWLALLLLFSSGLLAPSGGLGWTLATVAVVLLLPKAAALLSGWRRLARRHPPARGRLLRAVAAELALTSLLAPIVMVRQTIAVAQVLIGRDTGWRPAAAPGARDPRLEMAVGAALVAGSLAAGAGPAALILAPVAGPLLAAPWLVRWLDATPGRTRPPAVARAAPRPAEQAG